MTPQTGPKIITIHILPNISRSKGNQAMKSGQSIKYSVRNVFLHKSCRKWSRETRSRPILFFKIAFCKVKTSDQHLSFNIILVDLDLDTK